MKKSNNNYRFVAQPLPDDEIQQLLLKIGRMLRTERQQRTTLERFAYEIGISSSQMGKYEAGGNMLLSSFLKVVSGLDMSPEDFFKALEHPTRHT